MFYRYFLKLAYNGADYHGWQSQKNAHTVQQELEKALSTLSGGTIIPLTGAGRTDTGVHARNYYAHFDSKDNISLVDLEHLVYKLNQLLPDSIAVAEAFRVNNDAHARFSATSRKYRYYISRTYNPFSVGFAWRLTIPLDINLMNEAAALLLSHNDFKCFAKAGGQTKTTLCTIETSRWFPEGNSLVYEVKADRFLRNMVRAIVGTLIEVGKHRLSLEEFNQVLLNGSRSDAGQSVPAYGLFLEDVEYPDWIKVVLQE